MYTNFSFPLEYNIHPTLLPYPFTKKVLFTIIFKLMYCDVLEYVGIFSRKRYKQLFTFVMSVLKGLLVFYLKKTCKATSSRFSFLFSFASDNNSNTSSRIIN